MIENYDPNIYWSRHTYKVTLQCWEYVGSITCDMGGNLKGFEVMQAAIEGIADDLYEKYGENPTIELTKTVEGETHTLYCQPDGEDIDRWLLSMVVAVELIKYEEEK